jgi:hypothetical protein
MLFRLRMIWLHTTPFPLFRQQVVSLSQSSCVLSVDLTDGKGGGDVRGAKSFNCEEALSSLNHSILSVDHPFTLPPVVIELPLLLLLPYKGRVPTA